MKSYIEQLLEHIKTQIEDNPSVNFHLAVDEIFLNINQATPFGLLLNELISNSYNHMCKSADSTDKGEIYIELKKSENAPSSVQFVLSDNRYEFQSGKDISLLTPTEITLVNALSEQLNAEIKFGKQLSIGTVITIRFTQE